VPDEAPCCRGNTGGHRQELLGASLRL
jgi:hypothetical protein